MAFKGSTRYFDDSARKQALKVGFKYLYTIHNNIQVIQFNDFHMHYDLFVILYFSRQK